MKLRSFALAVVVLGSVFVLGPVAIVRLNQHWAWPRWDNDVGRVAGGMLILVGVGIATYATGLFRFVGHGTPMPIEPPTDLVVRGLYRYTRNPMYVADVMILIGLFLHRGELALLLYAGMFVALIQAWIVRHEEPVLRRRFGDAYDRYTASVPRWL